MAFVVFRTVRFCLVPVAVLSEHCHFLCATNFLKLKVVLEFILIILKFLKKKAAATKNFINFHFRKNEILNFEIKSHSD